MKFSKREVKRSEGAGNTFLKLEDGKSVQGVFRGEVFEFWQSWPKGGEKLVFDKPTAGANSRFMANFVMHEEGRFIAKVWEFPVAVYNQLADIAEVYDISKTKVRITRNGTSTGTTYSILPLLKEPIPEKAMKDIEAVELNPLGVRRDMPAMQSTPEPSFDECPF